MVFLLVLVAAALVSVRLCGGELRRLAQLELRVPWLLLVGAAVQVAVLRTWAGDLPHGAAGALHAASYLPAGVFVVANRRLAGMALIGAGGLANLVAIAANGGVMPASRWATRLAGRSLERGTAFRNSTPLARPRLPWLGDVLVWPAPLPGATAFSVGDVMLVAGLVVALHVTCSSRLARRGRRSGPSPRTFSRSRPPRTSPFPRRRPSASAC